MRRGRSVVERSRIEVRCEKTEIRELGRQTGPSGELRFRACIGIALHGGRDTVVRGRGDSGVKIGQRGGAEDRVGVCQADSPVADLCRADHARRRFASSACDKRLWVA